MFDLELSKVNDKIVDMSSDEIYANFVEVIYQFNRNNTMGMNKKTIKDTLSELLSELVEREDTEYLEMLIFDCVN